MEITTGAGTYECAKAEQHLDGVHLLDESDNTLLIITKPSDIRSVEDGEIIVSEQPEPTQLDVIEAQVTYTAMMTDTLLEV